MPTEDPHHWPIVSSYLEHADAGRLMVPKCKDCDNTFFPPRAACPYCLSSTVDLRESSGHGTIYSYSVVHIDYHPVWRKRTPYINALINLADGPVMFANIVDYPPEDVEVGRDVQVSFEEIAGQSLPVFSIE